MENKTLFHPIYLTLNYGEISQIFSQKSLYCSIIAFGYILIIVFNGAVISTIGLHKTLHEPMYIFIAALCLNGLYGSTVFFPGLFYNLLQETQKILYAACLIQVYCYHTYGAYEMTILVAMAYDRYVSICNPLRYNSIMTTSTVFKLMVGAWIYPNIFFAVHISLTVRLPLCHTEILKMYCDNWSVVRLSCVDTTVNNIFGLFITVALLGVPFVSIVYSYNKIFRICMRSKKVREKALQTCTPQLITLVIFIFDGIFEIILYRFVPTVLPYELRVITSLQYFVIPQVLNPLMYGLKIREIRTRMIEPLKRKR